MAGPLAGGGCAFALVEVIEGAPGDTRRSLRPWAELNASKDATVRDILERITAPRAAIAGLSVDRPRIMGIVNVTPDSFSDDGLAGDPAVAIGHGRRLVAEGADLVDIGGESTRPGSAPLPAEAELARVLPVIEGLADAGVPLSIDTRKASVMEEAVAAGAALVNDVSALAHDPASLATAAALGCPVVLMHMKGEPATMQRDPRYADVCLEVFDALDARIAACEAAGIARERLIADPGLGFGKTFAHNVELLRGLALFHGLAVALMVGASRKGFIGWLTGEKTASARAAGSVAAALAAVRAGAQLLRVHDVRETARALAVWRAIDGP